MRRPSSVLWRLLQTSFLPSSKHVYTNTSYGTDKNRLLLLLSRCNCGLVFSIADAVKIWKQSMESVWERVTAAIFVQCLYRAKKKGIISAVSQDRPVTGRLNGEVGQGLDQLWLANSEATYNSLVAFMLLAQHLSLPYNDHYYIYPHYQIYNQ